MTPGIAAVLECPHCEAEIRMRELGHPGLFKDYRICPQCGRKFTPDRETKHRQAVCIFVAIVSLALTLLLYFHGTNWLIPGLISYLVLGLMIYRGNQRIYLVPFEQDRETDDNNSQTDTAAGQPRNNRSR